MNVLEPFFYVFLSIFLILVTKFPPSQAQKSSLTSDQRLETLIEAKCEATATALKEGQVAEDFFRDTASQLTYYGLSRLHQEVRGLRCFA